MSTFAASVLLLLLLLLETVTSTLIAN